MSDTEELSSPLHAALAERREWSPVPLAEAEVEVLVAKACSELDSPRTAAILAAENSNTMIYRLAQPQGDVAIKVALRKSAELIALEFDRLVELAALQRPVPSPVLMLDDSPAYVLAWVDGQPATTEQFEKAITELASDPWGAADQRSLAPLAASTRTALTASPLPAGFVRTVEHACTYLETATSPVVCCHGDLHRDNILMASDQSTTLLDPRPNVSTMPFDWDLATCIVSHRLSLKGLPRSPKAFEPISDRPVRSAVLACLQILRLAELQILWTQDALITSSKAARARAHVGNLAVRLLGKDLERRLEHG